MNFIASNIRYIRERKNYTQEYFAEELKWNRSMVMAFESGRTQPSIEKLIELSVYINIPIDTLIKVDLRKTKDVSFIEIANKRVLFPIMIDDDNENIIEVVPVKSSAGYLSGYDDPEYIEQLSKMKLPFIPTGKHRAFPIKGDSMLPLKDGSFVVAKFIESIDDVRDGSTYIILTREDGMTYKRLFKKEETLLLKPDNPNFKEYEISKNEVLELWEFTCSINTREFNEHELKLSSVLELFNSLGVELKALEKAFNN